MGRARRRSVLSARLPFERLARKRAHRVLSWAYRSQHSAYSRAIAVDQAALGVERTREAAMAAFAKGWRRE